MLILPQQNGFDKRLSERFWKIYKRVMINVDYVDHHFRAELAQRYGVDAAIFLHNVFYWVKYNRANKKNLHNGRYWMYNSMAAFCDSHPYWSRRQIERIIRTCKDAGLLLVDCFNQDGRDRTSWYTLSDEAMRFFCDDAAETVECISQDGEMQITERGHALHQTGTPLPNNRTNNRITDPPQSPPEGGASVKKQSGRRALKEAPDWKPERFAKFWESYPLKKDKQKAIRAWDNLHLDKHLDDDQLNAIALALQRQLYSPEWQRKIREEHCQGIPYPSTWLNNCRWEDEVPPERPESQPSGAMGGGLDYGFR